MKEISRISYNFKDSQENKISRISKILQDFKEIQAESRLDFRSVEPLGYYSYFIIALYII